MKVLVTGGLGFVGSHLSVRLAEEAHDVVVVDKLTDYYDPLLKYRNLELIKSFTGSRVEIQERDIATLNSHEVGQFDVVVHLAAQPGVRLSWSHFDQYVRENITATNHIARLMVQAEVPRMVFASSSSVYGDATDFPTVESAPTEPLSPYGVTKLACEKLLQSYCASSDLSVAAMRFFTVYGPGQRPDMAIQRLILNAIDPAPTPFRLFGTGEQRRDFTYVGDIVAACMAAARAEVRGFTALNVGGGGDISINDLIRNVAEAVGREPLVRREATQKGDVFRTGSSNELARQILGWEPSVAVTAGLSKQVEFEQSHDPADWHSAVAR